MFVRCTKPCTSEAELAETVRKGQFRPKTEIYLEISGDEKPAE